MEHGLLGGHFLAYLVALSELNISFSVSDDTAMCDLFH
jgi:hypothetical protein